jgi:tRNA (guanine37-N1)-methyltransferase
MRFDVVTLFPAMFDAIAEYGVTGRALQQGLWELHRWNPRDFASRAGGRLDDRPFGGGPGMVMEAAPMKACVEAIEAQSGQRHYRVLLSPGGKPVKQADVLRLGQLAAVTLVAGRYEGIDQRFIDTMIDTELCMADFVVSGGELPAMMLIDAVVRWIPGVLNSGESARQDSFATGLLDHAHYTRPKVWHGLKVPETLLGGDHRTIARWRRANALLRTAKLRPDLVEASRRRGLLSKEDERSLEAAEQRLTLPLGGAEGSLEAAKQRLKLPLDGAELIPVPGQGVALDGVAKDAIARNEVARARIAQAGGARDGVAQDGIDQGGPSRE